MKIRVAFLDKNQDYIERISTALNFKFKGQFEIFLFTETKMALEALSEYGIHVLLASEEFEIDKKKMPKRCSLAWFTENAGTETFRDSRAVFRYQKIENIAAEITGLYSEKIEKDRVIKTESGKHAQITLFLSCGGGTGASTCAAACGVYWARLRQRVLYLNLEAVGSRIFFEGDGHGNLSDVVYLVKNGGANLGLKLMQYVRQDKNTGVFYIERAGYASDVKELTGKESALLISTLASGGQFDRIVLDLCTDLSEVFFAGTEASDQIVFVGDGSEISNDKLEYLVRSMEYIEKRDERTILHSPCILYNRFASRTGRKNSQDGLPELGGIPRYEGTSGEIFRQICGLSLFERLR